MRFRKSYLLVFTLIFVSALSAQVEIISAGTGTAYTLNVPGVFPLRSGAQITFKAHVNCAVNATIDVSSTGAIPITKNGNSSSIGANDIIAGQVVTIVYDGAKWQMISTGANTTNGTVTSVGLTAPSIFTVTNSPITSSGAISLAFQTLSNNVFLASPNNFGGLPSFRSIVSNDLPLVPLTKGGTNASLTAVSGGVVYSDASAFGITPAGTAGQVLQSNGTTAPSWVTPSFLPSGTTGQTLYNNSGSWTATSNLFNNGTNIGINTTTPGKISGAFRYLTLSQNDVYSNNTNVSLELQGSTNVGSGGAVSRIDFINYTGTSNLISRIESRTNSGLNNGNVIFSTHDGTNLNEAMRLTSAGRLGIGNTAPSSLLEVTASETSGSSATITNNIASGISGSVITFNNTGLRSIGHSAVIVNNLTTKSGGSNSTKIGLEVNSTGSWAPGTANQPNVGIKVTASGADNNYALQLIDGSQGINKVLRSDASGNASWTDLSALPGGLSGGTANYVAKWVTANSLSSTSLIFDNGTNVGIGTNNPAEKLDVRGNIDINGENSNPYIRIRNNSDPNFAAIGNSAACLVTNSISATALTIKDADGIQIVAGTDGATGINVLATGKVGVGTNAPLSKFNVSEGLAYSLLGSNPVNAQIVVGTNANQRLYLGSYYTAGVGAASMIQSADFYSNLDNPSDLAIQPIGGNVGIGVKDPFAKLHISGGDIATDWDFQMAHYHSSWGANASRPYLNKQWNGTIGDYMYLGSTGNTSNTVQSAIVLTGTSGILFGRGSDSGDGVSTEHMRVTTGGRVGIGTNNPGGILHTKVSNASYVTVESTQSGASPYGINFTSPDRNWYFLLSGGTTVGGSFGLYDGTASKYRWYVEPTNGYLGVNTTTPQYNLDVFSSSPAYAGRFVNTGTAGADGLKVEVATTATATGSRYGVYSTTWYGQTANYGMYAYGYGGTTAYGIYAVASGGTSSNFAGYFSGNVNVAGTLSKSAGTFKIDHPLDPENKILYHSFVESPDMMNIYNGNISTDNSGLATVQLPDYFEALNKDFRYQLTVIGDFAQAIVFKEIANNQFTIKTDKPNIKVSWQVTGIRHDPYADKNRVVPVVDKKQEDRGKYLNPLEYGKSEEMGVDYENIRRDKKDVYREELNQGNNSKFDAVGNPKK